MMFVNMKVKPRTVNNNNRLFLSSKLFMFKNTIKETVHGNVVIKIFYST